MYKTKYEEYKKLKYYQQQLLSKDLKKLLQIFQENIAVKGISYLIHLYVSQILVQSLIKIKQDSKQVHKAIVTIYHNIQKIMPKYFQINQKAGELFNDILNLQAYKKIQGEAKLCQDEPHNKKWQKLFDQYLLDKKMKNMHRFNEIVQEYLLTFQIKDYPEQQLCMNWLKMKLQQIRNNENGLCCKLIFFDKQKINPNEGKNVQYKKYFWPITSPNIQFHLKKTIVGFLNANGGIIYIGIQQTKEKTFAVNPIDIKQNRKADVYEFFRSLIQDNIHPKHRGFNIEQKNLIVSDYKKIPINEYISLEMMPVINEDTLFPVQLNEKGQSKYIIKLFVKIGHPKHFYHLIANQHMIDFFVRQDRNVQKKNFPDAYRTIYEKLENFDKYKNDNVNRKEGQTVNKQNLPQRPTFHNDCRYKMDVTIDIDSDSDDDTF